MSADAESFLADLQARAGEQRPERRLDATARALAHLRHPERTVPFIHVTGTNGKTSTSRIAAAVLGAHGRRVGVFTSPHLLRLNERIVLDGLPIPERALNAVWPEVSEALAFIDAELLDEDRPRITFFEALTVLAYASFERAGMDAAVVEVGMGGAWDSTNVGAGRVAVFTPISLDHQTMLGSSVEEIAETKAGIIKAGATVVVAAQPREALARIVARSESEGAKTLLLGEDFHHRVTEHLGGAQRLQLTGPFGEFSDLTLPLRGAHQAMNAAVGVVAADALLRPSGACMAGTRAGLGRAESPGRLEVVSNNPLVIVDAAHNPGGARVLVDALHEWPDIDEFGVVMGILADKDAAGITGELDRVASAYFITQSDSVRAISVDELRTIVGNQSPSRPLSAFRSPVAAYAAATAWAAERERRAVVVTGSITLAGQLVR
jgi:dihydrofolate synthase/folylpolyglutamate synthase